MAAVTSAMVKELRERTSAGIMDCKKALVESDGDMEKAIEWLREKGLSQAAKKASRIAAEGVVAQYTSEDGAVGVIVEVKMCIRDRGYSNVLVAITSTPLPHTSGTITVPACTGGVSFTWESSVSYTHLAAHAFPEDGDAAVALARAGGR